MHVWTMLSPRQVVNRIVESRRLFPYFRFGPHCRSRVPAQWRPPPSAKHSVSARYLGSQVAASSSFASELKKRKQVALVAHTAPGGCWPLPRQFWK
eukprot:2137128-Pyramimonas_sp.AAC.1